MVYIFLKDISILRRERLSGDRDSMNMCVNNKGMILIISLWVLVIISLLCLSLANQVRADLKLIKSQKDKIKCLYIAKAALEKAITVLESDSTPDADSLNELWSKGIGPHIGDYIFKDVAIGDGFFTISYLYGGPGEGRDIYFYGMSDEDRKVNINRASKELLVALGEVLQLDSPQSLAEDIIYGRGDSHIKNIEELSLIKRFKDNSNLIKKCERFFTVYTKDSLININTAPEKILKSVFISLGADKFSPGLSQRLARDIIDYRDGEDNVEATADDVLITQDKIKEAIETGLADIVEKSWVDKQVLPFKPNSDIFRIEVVARLNTSRINKNVSVIVDRSQRPSKVIYWYEK
jgi:DNA uptake protein ComE-like DNA-binding protein/type II secretory pathway pseudopilin PulG